MSEWRVFYNRFLSWSLLGALRFLYERRSDVTHWDLNHNVFDTSGTVSAFGLRDTTWITSESITIHGLRLPSKELCYSVMWKRGQNNLRYHSWTQRWLDHCVLPRCDTDIFYFSIVEERVRWLASICQLAQRRTLIGFALRMEVALFSFLETTLHICMPECSVGWSRRVVKGNLFSSGIGQWASPFSLLSIFELYVGEDAFKAVSQWWQEIKPRAMFELFSQKELCCVRNAYMLCFIHASLEFIFGHTLICLFSTCFWIP